MRQKFFMICLLVLLYPSVGLSQQIPPLVAEQGYADMVLLNGKIVSMDDRSATPNTPGNTTQAMAIKGERIMALGSNAEMRRISGPNPRNCGSESESTRGSRFDRPHPQSGCWAPRVFSSLRWSPEP